MGKMAPTMTLLSVAPMMAKPTGVNGNVIEDTDELMDDESDVEEACDFVLKQWLTTF